MSNTQRTNAKTFNVVGGSDTNVLFEFTYFDNNSNIKTNLVHMGSIISLSYSVYRNKKPVFNIGSHTVDGFSVGEKYVAGSIIKTMFVDDDFAGAINKIKQNISNESRYNLNLNNVISPRQFATIMADDILECNIIVLYCSEYENKVVKEVIKGATFINNGQVMSINDIITETTISYIAKDVVPHHYTDSEMGTLTVSEYTKKASDLFLRV